MHDVARSWFDRRTYSSKQWSPGQLVAAKRASGLGVSVVLPAHNEARTVGNVVSTIRHALVDRHPLVDELVVVDSWSTDATAERAAAAGARVVRCQDVAPEFPAGPGKGEALWRSLFATEGDLVVFIDADLVGAGPHYITGLLGPLLTEPAIAYVKGFYDRPIGSGDSVRPTGGGRVTELVARPLLNMYWPELAGFAQPLAGEYAGRREVLEQIPFVTGYGIEFGMLVDVANLVGLDALAQVDLGSRRHRNRPDVELGAMAAEIIVTAVDRLAGPAPRADELTQFGRHGPHLLPVGRDLVTGVRPPAQSVPSYGRTPASTCG